MCILFSQKFIAICSNFSSVEEPETSVQEEGEKKEESLYVSAQKTFEVTDDMRSDPAC